MKYLIIGDAGSMHIFNYIRTVLMPKKYDVHIFTLSVLPVREEYRDFYRNNNITVHSVAEKNYRGLEKKDKLHRMLNLWRKFRLFKEIPYCDICHVHSVYKTAIAIVLKNRKKIGKLILSYWGGDIEDRSEAVVKLREKCFCFADVITVTAKQTYKDFKEIYGNKYDYKVKICRFATAGIDCIEELRRNSTREECRNTYGIAGNEICVTCGYSAYAEQHQDTCLEMLKKMPADVRKRLHVLVPMQYGRVDEVYIEKVRRIASSCDFKCDILEKFVPFEMSAKLAVATDVYLHVRDTDAFSNALKEHVFAGSCVVIGSWLKYPELVEMKFPIIWIEKLEELETALEKILEEIEIDEEIITFSPLYKLYSTESIVKQWGEVLDFIQLS